MSIAPPSDRLNAILARHYIITATLNAGPDPETFVALSRELSELDGVVNAIRAYRAMEDNLNGLQALIDDASTDAEMRSLAEDELPQAREDLEKAAQSPQDAVRAQTALVLGLIGDKSGLKILRVIKRDKNAAVRQQALEAMWRMGDEEAMKELVGYAACRYVDDQMFALQALANGKSAMMKDTIEGYFASDFVEVELTAARALGQPTGGAGRAGIAQRVAEQIAAHRLTRLYERRGGLYGPPPLPLTQVARMSVFKPIRVPALAVILALGTLPARAEMTLQQYLNYRGSPQGEELLTSYFNGLRDALGMFEDYEEGDFERTGRERPGIDAAD